MSLKRKKQAQKKASKRYRERLKRDLGLSSFTLYVTKEERIYIENVLKELRISSSSSAENQEYTAPLCPNASYRVEQSQI